MPGRLGIFLSRPHIGLVQCPDTETFHLLDCTLSASQAWFRHACGANRLSVVVFFLATCTESSPTLASLLVSTWLPSTKQEVFTRSCFETNHKTPKSVFAVRLPSTRHTATSFFVKFQNSDSWRAQRTIHWRPYEFHLDTRRSKHSLQNVFEV